MVIDETSRNINYLKINNQGIIDLIDFVLDCFGVQPSGTISKSSVAVMGQVRSKIKRASTKMATGIHME